MLNKCSKRDFISVTLLIIVALILKVVRNFIPKFSFRRFDVVSISNDCTCVN